MTDPTREIAPPRAPSHTFETFRDALESLRGQLVTIVNPESYEDAPLGHHLTTSFYRARVLGVGQDVITIATDYKRKRGDLSKEPVRQFIPIDRVKRLSVMKRGVLLHI